MYVLAGLVAASLQQDTVASVPGLAGRDYPALAAVPRTRFTCRGQVQDTRVSTVPRVTLCHVLQVDGGYYGDPDTGCQAFHLCADTGAEQLSKVVLSAAETLVISNTLVTVQLPVPQRHAVPAGVPRV